MIEELRIQGIGVIDEALLSFSPGFTVITGETGAGKTMILSAYNSLSYGYCSFCRYLFKGGKNYQFYCYSFCSL